MHLKLYAFIGAALLLVAVPARADASCCEQGPNACCAATVTPCCDKDVDIIGMLMAEQTQLTPAPPIRQTFEVWFKRPTVIGKSILQGRYVIEHDNERMARGEPCTHIYAYEDRDRPVVKFHCVHLERDRSSTNRVMLNSLYDGWQELTEFQFAGETASHGYPVR